MTNILIRDVPAEVVALIDAKAHRLGLSRTEYLRRALASDGRMASMNVSVADLARFSETFADLDDAEEIACAWT